LAVKALCIIASGSKPAAFTSGHDGEEFDKRLTAALIEAHPAVFLDNFNAKELRSDVLASALTEDPATVRPMGQTKMVPLHTRTFITITGNAVEIAEDMARRTITTNFDAKVEDPELRKFAPGFLDQVFAARAVLLADALTIWRWGRQNRLSAGKPLGNYERWAQWCRDPLITLGMRDPVERLAEIKAADPRRRALIAVFDAWWAAHGDAMVKATELAPEVIEQIDIKAFRKPDNTLQFSRQRVARFLDAHKSTRVGGYALIQTKSGKLSKPIAYYQLTGGQAHE
jgi:putative DNA primase/helicase